VKKGWFLSRSEKSEGFMDESGEWMEKDEVTCVGRTESEMEILVRSCRRETKRPISYS